MKINIDTNSSEWKLIYWAAMFGFGLAWGGMAALYFVAQLTTFVKWIMT
jgi:hypothetical protein